MTITDSDDLAVHHAKKLVSEVDTALAAVEPLINPENNRFTVYPIEHPDLWQFYKKAVSSFWVAEEIVLDSDRNDWEKMTEGEKTYISMVLAFFASSDNLVNANLVERFYNECMYQECKAFYSFQIAMECIHAETYSLLIDNYVRDPEEKNRLFNAISTIPSIQKKAEWALKWIHDEKSSFAHRLIAFGCVEGIFFSGSFAALFFLKAERNDLLKGLTFSNDLISRDEALHCEFACALYRDHWNSKLAREDVLAIVCEAVEIEQEFVTESLPVSMLGMNSKLMSEYIEFVGDRLLMQLGYEAFYNTKNPFLWMARIGLEGKTNFFEKRVGEYQKSMDSGANVDFKNHEDVDF